MEYRRQEAERPAPGMAGDLSAGEFQGGARFMSGRLKVHVNQDKCQGHARCKSLAPDLFDLDEYGNAHEVGDGSVPAGLEDKAYLARSNCPEIAIEVTEE
jgi:ferredoxin